jgi:hypothetical protein
LKGISQYGTHGLEVLAGSDGGNFCLIFIFIFLEKGTEGLVGIGYNI